MPILDLPLDTPELRNPKHLHGLVMSLSGATASDSDTPRADLGFQYRLDLPGDVLGVGVSPRVGGDQRARITWRDVFHEPAHLDRDRFTLMLRVNAIARNGRRERPWYDNESHDRVKDLLWRNGMAVDEEERFVVGPALTHDFVVARDVLATVDVVDPEKAQKALDNGIGRGKNYGCGMIVLWS